MTIDQSILNKLYPNTKVGGESRLTQTPTPVLPVVTQSDIDNGYLTRYFIRPTISVSGLMEIDSKQFSQFRNNPLFRTTSIRWKIVGKPYTITLPNGAIDMGVEDFNKEQVENAEKTFGGLSAFIRDYLNLWYCDDNGNRKFVRKTDILNPAKRPIINIFTRIDPPSVFNPNYIPPAPPAPTPTPGAIILTRTVAGKIAALSTASLYDGIIEAFDSSSVNRNIIVSQSAGGYVRVQENGRLRVGVTGGGDAYFSFPNIGSISSSFVQAVIANSTTSGTAAASGVIYQRVQTLNSSRIVSSTSTFGGFPTANITEYRTNGSTAQSINGTGTSNSFPGVFQTSVSSSVATLYQRMANGASTSITMNNVTSSLPAGEVIVSYGGAPNPGSWLEYSSMFVMKGPNVIVRCSQVNDWYARILTDTDSIITSASAVNNTASINLDASRTRFPAPYKIEIRNPSTHELYHYLVPEGRIWGGDEYEVKFVPGAVTPPPPATEFNVVTASREDLGRIVAFATTPVAGVSSPFTPSGWLAPLGITITTSSGNLSTASPAANTTRLIPYTASGMFSQLYVQHALANRSTGAAAGAGALLSASAASGTGSGVALSVPGGFTGTPQLIETVENTLIQSASSAPANANISVRSWVGVHTGSAFGAASGSTINASYVLGSPLTVQSGWGGIYHSAGSAVTLTHREFIMMKSHLVTVRANLPVIYVVQLLNASNVVLATTTANANGEATIDCFTHRIVFPAVTKLRILNTSLEQLYEIEPPERIWGGDIWNLDVTQ